MCVGMGRPPQRCGAQARHAPRCQLRKATCLHARPEPYLQLFRQFEHTVFKKFLVRVSILNHHALFIFCVLRLTPCVFPDSLFVVIMLAHVLSHLANIIELKVQFMAEKNLNESMRGLRSKAKFASNMPFTMTLKHRNHCNRQQTK